MKITPEHGDELILRELGARARSRRMQLNLRQADLAYEAGVNPKVVMRLEAGESVNTSSLIRILRGLGLAGSLDGLLPEAGPTPIEVVDRGREQRQRVRLKRSDSGRKPVSSKRFKWGDVAHLD